jgi:hypothetical protein
VQLYLEEGSRETFAALPNKLKTKLIGNKQWYKQEKAIDIGL